MFFGPLIFCYDNLKNAESVLLGRTGRSDFVCFWEGNACTADQCSPFAKRFVDRQITATPVAGRSVTVSEKVLFESDADN